MSGAVPPLHIRLHDVGRNNITFMYNYFTWFEVFVKNIRDTQ